MEGRWRVRTQVLGGVEESACLVLTIARELWAKEEHPVPVTKESVVMHNIPLNKQAKTHPSQHVNWLWVCWIQELR